MTSNNASLVEADRAVRAVLDEAYTAWADNDADAFVAPYAETATAVLPGSYLPDREAIRATMSTLFAGELNGAKGVHEVQSVRFVGANVAIVISKGAMLLAGQTEPDAGDLGAVRAERHLARPGLPQLSRTHHLSEKGDTTMPSKQSEAVKRFWTASRIADELPADEQPDDESWGDLTAEPREVDYIETDAGGLSAMWAAPKRSTEDRVLLCLHGGGFIAGSIYTHRKMFGHLAKATGARALIFDYRLAPEHIHPTQVDDATAVYRWLLDQGISADHIAFTGDSSGGGLSITTQLRARERGLPLPAAAMPMSPWVDMEVIGESYETNRDRCAFYPKEDVREFAGMFLGEGGDPRDPLANPLYADLAGLGPIYIQVGGDEGLLDDSRRLDEHARRAGVDVQLDVFPGMQHTFQMAAGRAPEADEAIRRMSDWVRPKLNL